MPSELPHRSTLKALATRVANDELWPSEGDKVSLRVERDFDGVLALVVYGTTELERFELVPAAAAYLAGALAHESGVRFDGG